MVKILKEIEIDEFIEVSGNAEKLLFEVKKNKIKK